MSHLITAITAALIGAGITALAMDAIVPRDASMRVVMSDLDNCYADLDACEALRSGMECK